MKRALVIGAGGPLGAAWEVGIAAGLEAVGVVLREADRIVGTSAGAIVGSQLAAGRSAQAMLDGQVARARDLAHAAGSAPRKPQSPPRFLEELVRASRAEGPWEMVLAEIGARALETQTVIPEERFIANFQAITTPGAAWPVRFACTAIDAQNGARRVWDASSGVDLVRAVASSCCAPYVAAPIALNGSRFMDGGLHSTTNADLAQGFERVLIIAVVVPMTEALAKGQINQETSLIEASGGQVAVITPDACSVDAMGLDLMDGARGANVAHAGFEQGRAEGTRVRSGWAANY